MPSWAFSMACRVPPISARRLSLLTRPAASSDARLMRNPEDSFSRDFDSPVPDDSRLRYALNAATFWLMRKAILPTSLLALLLGRRPCRLELLSRQTGGRL